MEFYEEQKFDKLWIWFLLICPGLLPTGLFGYGLVKQVYFGLQFGDKPMSNNGLIAAFILCLLLSAGLLYIFLYSRLTTRIDRFGVEFRFFPFHSKCKSIPWSEIERFEVRKYNSLSGYGIKSSLNKKIYNISGNMGLQLHLKTGKQILIGTQKETVLNEFIKKLKT